MNKTDKFRFENEASGKTLSEAKNRAEKIKYKFVIQGNRLILDNYFITSIDNKFRDQNVTIRLYLPRGIQFKVDKSVKEFDHSDNEYFNLHFSSDEYIYKVLENSVICTNCPDEENEDENDETTIKTTLLNINGEDIITTETYKNNEVLTTDVNGEKAIIKTTNVKKGLTTDKNGIIIKNQ